MKSRAWLPLIGLAFLISGCASVVDGTSQNITFNTNPPGASCSLERKDIVIGQVAQTPGSVLIKKTKDNIKATCKKDGYQEATAVLKSEVQGSTWGNIILGGGIGWAVDSASGADNHYQDIVNVTMLPVQVAAETIRPGPPPSACDTLNLENAMMTLIDRRKSDKTTERVGRGEVIYGRYADDAKQVREGFMRAAYENERDTAVGTNCDEAAHLEAARKALPEESKTKYPEAKKIPITD